MKIYTRTGDTGQTSIVGGARLPKDAPRIEAYGTIDELNAHIGALAADSITTEPRRKILVNIQNNLFNIGAFLAGTPDPGITPDHVAELETDIDTMDRELPRLNSFILPGGCRLAARAHIARTICRRAERRIISITPQLDIPPLLMAYINRLSDWLFTFARHANLITQTPEQFWQK